jgi:hypothetical protein
MTLDEWDSAVLGSTGVCTPKETFAPGTLGGEPALVGPGSCTDGYDYLQAEALHGRRGYLLMVVSATIDSRVPADPALFRTALHSFRFTSK